MPTAEFPIAYDSFLPGGEHWKKQVPPGTDTGPAWGLEGVRRLRRASQHVLTGIGGINAGNAGDVIRAGADGVAVVSALCAAADPREAARELAAAVAAARRGQP